ncbi:MAG: YqgE/AlgH family protein [Desulfobacterales bacterium]
MKSQLPAGMRAQFLIAMPGLLDPNFFKTVTCICEHTAEGALGIVVNRAHPEITVKEILAELQFDYVPEVEHIPIYIGGPVHFDEIFILHGPPFDWQGCLRISSTLALSNTKDILSAIAMGKGPQNIMIALGCAGWGPGQLESELVQNAWLTGPVSDDIIFEIPEDDRWDAAVKKMGIDPALLSHTAGHA